nr:MAG TPA: hypothetical protein [Caudoviricetes sp.]
MYLSIQLADYFSEPRFRLSLNKYHSYTSSQQVLRQASAKFHTMSTRFQKSFLDCFSFTVYLTGDQVWVNRQ